MPYFAGHPITRGFFVGTLVLWALVELRRSLKGRSEATNMDGGSRIVLTLSWVAAFLAASLSRAKVTGAGVPDGAVTFGVGLATVWAGIGLRWWSVRTLGRYFTVEVMTSADQPVVTTGPYSFVRHPSYAGLVLIFGGIGIIFGNWLSLAALIVLPLAGLVYRIRVEEAALSAALGERYKVYAARRKRLFPLVW